MGVTEEDFLVLEESRFATDGGMIAACSIHAGMCFHTDMTWTTRSRGAAIADPAAVVLAIGHVIVRVDMQRGRDPATSREGTAKEEEGNMRDKRGNDLGPDGHFFILLDLVVDRGVTILAVLLILWKLLFLLLSTRPSGAGSLRGQVRRLGKSKS